MFNKLWKPVALLVAMVAGLAAAPQASAQWAVRPSPALRHAGWQDFSIQIGTVARHRHDDYHVYYRTCNHSPWRCYGHYDCPQTARRVAYRLERQGYDAYVR